MASLTTPQENKTNINHAIKQAKNAQDFTTSGTSDDGSFVYLVSADTHGRGPEKTFFTDLFAKMSWREILKSKNFFEVIQNEIKKKIHTKLDQHLVFVKFLRIDLKFFG